jgi:glycosyltransferase Alg8
VNHAFGAAAQPPPRATSASFPAQLATGVICLLALVLAASLMFDGWGHQEIIIEEGLILGIGVVAAWRYGWWCVHLVRSLIYAGVAYPRMARAAAAVAPSDLPRELFVLVTSYKTRRDITARVYRALFAEGARYPGAVTIVSAFGDAGDEAEIRRAWAETGPADGLNGGGLKLVMVQQDGTGKRRAMAEALRAIGRRSPGADSLTVFMDGDSVLLPGTLARSAAFFVANPALGAATTDNRAIADGSATLREWYELRLTQRHLLMQSMALSRRLLVLTGRFSVFRSLQVMDPSFIARLEYDEIDHWRLGRIAFLSGDDKSTWFELIKTRAEMIYLRDVTVLNVEDPLAGGFVANSTQLMRRWYGNMLRTNGRAIALGPRRVGPFVWWCLVDQRLSMWTTMVGPVSVLLLASQYGLRVVGAYAVWVILSRTLVGVALGAMRGRFSAYYMPLLVYGQIVGALVKIRVCFNLNVQRWSRQNIVAAAGPHAGRQRRIGRMIEAMAFGWLVLAVGAATHVIRLPDAMTVSIASDVLARDGHVPPPERSTTPKESGS